MSAASTFPCLPLLIVIIGLLAASASSASVDSDGVGLASSSIDLQALFSPRLQSRLTSVTLATSFSLDPLAFLPRLVLNRDLRVCGGGGDGDGDDDDEQRRGRPPSVVLTGSSPFKMVRVNATLSLCSVRFDLRFALPPPASRIDTLLFDVDAGGAAVVYTDVEFVLDADGYDRVTRHLARLNRVTSVGEGIQTSASLTSIRSLDLPLARLRNVTIFQEAGSRFGGRGVTPPPSEVSEPKSIAEASDPLELTSALTAAEGQDAPPLEVTINSNFSVSRCLVERVGDGPIVATSPVTVLGSAANTWLRIDPDLAGGRFVDVRSQLRFQDMSMEVGRLGIGPLDGFPGRVRRSPFSFDAASPGCRLVVVDVVIAVACEEGDGGRGMVAMIGEEVLTVAEVMEVERLGGGSMRLARFMGGGMCFQNATIMCGSPRIEREVMLVPGCADEQEQGGGARMREVEETFSDSIDLEGDGDPTTTPTDDGSSGSSGANTAIVVLFGVLCAGIVLLVAVVVYTRRQRIRQCLRPNKSSSNLTGAFASRGVNPEDYEREESLSGRFREEDEDIENGGSYANGGNYTSNGGGNGGGSGGSGVEEDDDDDDVFGGVDDEGAGLMGGNKYLLEAMSSGDGDNWVTIEETIATGGYGVVYKGIWKGVPVAIKTVVFQDSVDDKTTQRQRAVFEAAISSSVHHPNIVQTYAYMFKKLEGVAGGGSAGDDRNGGFRFHTGGAVESIVDWKLYIVQEFCNCGSLRAFLDEDRLLARDGRMDMQQAVRIAFEAACGMHHLHKYDIVHGDLSTKNVLLKRDDCSDRAAAKIADFGLSYKMKPLESHVSGRRAGTPFYMAPELARQGRLSKQADAFSFGVLMWELYHSEKCYQTTAISGVQYHPLFPKFPIACPLPYALLCAACISPDPVNRPSFKFIEQALSALSFKQENGEYDDEEQVRLDNLATAAKLECVAGEELLRIIADLVGVSLETFCNKVKMLRKIASDNPRSVASLPVEGLPDPRLVLSTSAIDLMDEAHQPEGLESSSHLNQAATNPLHCLVTVESPSETNGGGEEILNLAWKSASHEASQMMTTMSDRATSGTSLDFDQLNSGIADTTDGSSDVVAPSWQSTSRTFPYEEQKLIDYMGTPSENGRGPLPFETKPEGSTSSAARLPLEQVVPSREGPATPATPNRLDYSKPPMEIRSTSYSEPRLPRSRDLPGSDEDLLLASADYDSLFLTQLSTSTEATLYTSALSSFGDFFESSPMKDELVPQHFPSSSQYPGTDDNKTQLSPKQPHESDPTVVKWGNPTYVDLETVSEDLQAGQVSQTSGTGEYQTCSGSDVSLTWNEFLSARIQGSRQSVGS